MVKFVEQPPRQTPAIPPSTPDILNRIPIEILCAIFFECVPADRNPVLSPTEAPMLLTHVSQTWRSVAHQTPRLWTRLHIAATIVFYSEDRGDGIEAEDVNLSNSVLERRVQLAREWMSRAGDLPLSLSIFLHVFPCHAWATSQYLAIPFFEQTFNLLAQNAHRIQAIDFTGPLVGILSAEKQLSRASFPRLSEVRLRISGKTLHIIPTWAASSALEQGVPSSLLLAPNIKKLTFLDEAESAIWPTPQACWRGLTHLIIHSRNPVVDIHLIFKLCSSLVVLHLYKTRNVSDIGNASLLSSQPIELPFLTALHLLECSFNSEPFDDGIGQVFDMMHAPSLEEIGYAQKGKVPDVQRFQLIHLLKKSPKIRTCFLEISGIPPRFVTAAFNYVFTTLTSLTVSGTRFHGDGPTESIFHQNRELVDLGMNCDISNEIDIGDNIMRQLPCLESLTVLCLPLTNTDTEILDLVKERIDLWKMDKVSSICDFKIAFIRAQQRDIMPEICELAAAVGIVINMQLSYRRLRPGRRIPLSPSLGVDNETWDRAITTAMFD